jgi:hypothetical protein
MSDDQERNRFRLSSQRKWDKPRPPESTPCTCRRNDLHKIRVKIPPKLATDFRRPADWSPPKLHGLHNVTLIAPLIDLIDGKLQFRSAWIFIAGFGGTSDGRSHILESRDAQSKVIACPRNNSETEAPEQTIL